MKLRKPALAIALVAAAFTLTAASCDDMYGCRRWANPSGYSYTSECTMLGGKQQNLHMILDDGAAVWSSGWSASRTVIGIVPNHLRHMRITSTWTDVR